MKVMVMVKASPSSEAGKMPSAELLTAMGNFNEQLVKAGVMLSGDGLKPTSEGYRVRFSGKERTVTKGPFGQTSELLAGYWIWNVESMEEALEWVKKCPNPMEEDSDIEIRRFYEMEDFAEVDTSGEVAQQEAQMLHTMALQQSTIQTYLFFSGRCEEALEYYQTHLGASVKYKLRFNESPDPLPEGMLQSGFENKIMHAEFQVGDTRILASDGCDDSTPFSGCSLAMTLPTEGAARRVFEALADGGKVAMPLATTFWSPLFGQVTDRFGVAWMVMVAGAPAGQ